MEHFDVEPDLMIVAKSIAGGLPLSGVIGRAQIMDDPHAGAIGGTFIGNPVALAAACAVLDVFAEEQIVARAQVLGTPPRRMESGASGPHRRRAGFSAVAIELWRPRFKRARRQTARRSSRRHATACCC
jgi:adenosylmethionine-8-amino-7-oxononanoate aminotransferase